MDCGEVYDALKTRRRGHIDSYVEKERSRLLRSIVKEKLYRLKRAVVEKVIRIGHMKTDSETFCRQWAELESKDTKFWTRYEPYWGDKPWRVEFYDRHRWNGEDNSWNGHDVGHGQGRTLEDAWRDLETAILEYSRAASREEALLKAELNARAYLPRGWGCKEYAAYYRRNWMA